MSHELLTPSELGERASQSHKQNSKIEPKHNVLDSSLHKIPWNVFIWKIWCKKFLCNFFLCWGFSYRAHHFTTVMYRYFPMHKKSDFFQKDDFTCFWWYFVMRAYWEKHLYSSNLSFLHTCKKSKCFEKIGKNKILKFLDFLCIGKYMIVSHIQHRIHSYKSRMWKKIYKICYTRFSDHYT